MNKQSLYLFGGALLATTALSTAGNAATIRASVGDGAAPSTSAITAYGLATQVFSGTTTVANSVSIGNSASNVTANNVILVDYAAQLSTPFNIQLDVVNAAFSGTPTLLHYRQTTGGTLELIPSGSVTGCSVQTLPDKILVSSCDPTAASVSGSVLSPFAAGTTRVDAIGIVGVTFTSGAALATAGTSIQLSGQIRNTSNTVTFESISSANYVTSKSAIDQGLAAGPGVTINNNASPAFVSLVTSTTNPTSTIAQLGSIKYSTTSAVGTDLSLTFTAATVASTAEIFLTHNVLTDPAVVSANVNLATAVSKTTTQFVTNTVSFQVLGNSLNTLTVSVTFNGSTPISAASGATGTVTPTAGSTLIQSSGAFTGSLASFSRGGLSVELNTLMPTAGTGSTLYRSFLRIANTSAIDGVATVTVKNDNTGATVGSFTTTVSAGATRQIGSADIESNITTAAATGAPYKVIISGSFNGYVQNLLWNSVTGLFTDLSGFRNGALTTDP